MKQNNLKGSLILALAALIWGLAFVAQNQISDTVPTFTINALRSFIASIFLFIFWKITNIKTKAKHKKLFVNFLIIRPQKLLII